MGRKKGTGKGSVFYNKQRNTWTAQPPETENGEIKLQKKSFETKEEAEKYLEVLAYQREDSLYIKHNGIPLCELMKVLTERKYKEEKIKANQYGRLLKTIKSIENVFKDKKIEDVTSKEIQNYLNHIKEEKKYSKSEIKKHYQQFSQTFYYALDKKYIARTPMTDVYNPGSKKKAKKVKPLRIKEQQKLTKYLEKSTIKEEPYKNEFLMQLYMGLRVGETLALRNTDVDLEDKTISICKTLTTDENGKVIMGKTPKTEDGIRILPIPDKIMPYILEQLEISKNNRDGQLFLSKNDNLVDHRNVNRSLHKILDKLGVTSVSTHSLRHTYATRCAHSGMKDVVLQYLMGHSDISITKQYYITADEDFQEEQLRELYNFFDKNNMFFEQNNELEK